MHSLRSSIQSVSTTKRTSQTQHKTFSNITTSSSVQKSESILESLSEQTQFTQQKSVTTVQKIKTGQRMAMQEIKSNSEQEVFLEKSMNIGNFSAMSKLDSFNCDDVFDSAIIENGDIPPALPVKTRKKSTKRERHVSTYDNVEDAEVAEQK